jgi:tetratricopeptide (TPR) repeat protein
MERRPTNRPVAGLAARLSLRPAPRPGAAPRLAAFFGAILTWFLEKITPIQILLFILAVPFLLYVYQEAHRDVLIIDPISVPKQFQEAGLTPEVMANRIGDELGEIEYATRTRMKKDNLALAQAVASTSDIEIPGTKLGLKTAVEITRSLIGVYPKHVSGDIAFAPVAPAEPNTAAVKNSVTVTIYVSKGPSRGWGAGAVVPADNIDALVQTAAVKALEQVNPYVYGAYLSDHRDYAGAVAVAEKLTQDPSTSRQYSEAAFILWGTALGELGRYEEAIAKYQKAIELDPRDAYPYVGLGNALDRLGKYEEAIVKDQKAAELDPKYANAYSAWGSALDHVGKYGEAITKCEKSIELDPGDAYAYNNWGNALDGLGKHENAIAKYQKAIELDPKFTWPYNNWGVALDNMGKYEEAVAEYQKATEIDPKYGKAWHNWGVALDQLGRHAEAEEKLQKARELSAAQ